MYFTSGFVVSFELQSDVLNSTIQGTGILFNALCAMAYASIYVCRFYIAFRITVYLHKILQRHLYSIVNIDKSDM